MQVYNNDLIINNSDTVNSERSIVVKQLQIVESRVKGTSNCGVLAAGIHFELSSVQKYIVFLRVIGRFSGNRAFTLNYQEFQIIGGLNYR